MKIIKRFIFLFALICSTSLWAQDIPKPMSPPRLVNDFASILSSDENATLEQKLRAFNDSTSNQIYVVIVSDLLGYDVSDFAFRIGNEWGIGQKGKNNGIVILIKPKIGTDRGHAFIATGYGMEEYVPDAITNRIVDLEMIPQFKLGDYYSGIDAAINVIMDLVAGKYNADQYTKKKQSSPIGIGLLAIIFLILFLIFRGNNKTRRKTLGSNIPFWLAMGMLSNRSHGGFGNFSSGSGSFGGFGGFGGGGGGSFGGGGAGGSW